MPLSKTQIEKLLNSQLKKWEIMEAWLTRKFGDELGEFTSRDLAAELDIPRQKASDLIQAYLAAQRNDTLVTTYMLKRRERTRAAVWSVGSRIDDAKAIGKTLNQDVRVKVFRAFKPDLERLKALNQDTAVYVEARINQVINAALVMLAAALDEAQVTH